MSDSETKFFASQSSSEGAFNTTHWSVVLRAGVRELPASAAALEKLCRCYWFPIYFYVRRQGHDVHAAQDLTQEFFSRFLQGKGLDSVHPDKGRFRSFLIASLRHFLANEWKHSQRQKRGGGVPHFSIEGDLAEGRYERELADHFTPEKAFERRWAAALLQRVLDRLQDEWQATVPGAGFGCLKPFLLDTKGSASFREASLRLGMTEASLKWAVHRFRRQYGRIFREEIAHTVSSPDEVDDEIRHLFKIMSD